ASDPEDKARSDAPRVSGPARPRRAGGCCSAVSRQVRQLCPSEPLRPPAYMEAFLSRTLLAGIDCVKEIRGGVAAVCAYGIGRGTASPHLDKREGTRNRVPMLRLRVHGR